MCITESYKNVGDDQNVSKAFIGGYKICNLLYWYFCYKQCSNLRNFIFFFKKS